MSTYATKKTDIKMEWHHIDAKGKVLGQIATDIVRLLTGKHKVDYVTYLNCGDKVLVTNARKVVLTGNKETNKIYFTHSSYIGNLKQETAEQLRNRKPEDIIFNAVNGMLPKNKLRKKRLANLHIYADENHPHSAQLGGKNG